jgi:hypothetical protein
VITTCDFRQAKQKLQSITFSEATLVYSGRGPINHRASTLAQCVVRGHALLNFGGFKGKPFHSLLRPGTAHPSRSLPAIAQLPTLALRVDQSLCGVSTIRCRATCGLCSAVTTPPSTTKRSTRPPCICNPSSFPST